MTVGVCLLGYPGLSAYVRNSSAISAEAEWARESVSALMRDVERSHSLFGAKSAAISELLKLASEFSEAGWDGNGAAAIDPVAVATAQDFVRALSVHTPLPEFAPEPDGSLSLDWIQAKQRRFTISIGDDDRLAYAWVDGSDKGHGVARFDGCNIPERVMQGIESITEHANAPVRAA